MCEKNDLVVETRIIEKHKNLVFWDPDEKCNCTVFHKNMEFVKKRGEKGWHVIGIPHDARLEVESFTLELAIELMKDTDQANGVGIIGPAEEDAEVEAEAEAVEDSRI